MPKLHERLAVSKDRRGQVEQVRKDLAQLFDKKSDHFREQLLTYRPKAEGEKTITETKLSLQTTVLRELGWFAGLASSMLDTELEIAVANQHAVADITLSDGTVLAQKVPATALLDLEKRLTDYLGLLKHIPTLDPTKGFTPDEGRGQGVYVAREQVRQRTAKLQKPIVLYPATDKHPAQTQLITEDEVVGDLTVQEWSGMLTPEAKASMLERIEDVRRAVKEARSRANEVSTSTQKIGSALFNYILTNKRT
jgi:hypothetical protein